MKQIYFCWCGNLNAGSGFFFKTHTFQWSNEIVFVNLFVLISYLKVWLLAVSMKSACRNGGRLEEPWHELHLSATNGSFVRVRRAELMRDTCTSLPYHSCWERHMYDDDQCSLWAPDPESWRLDIMACLGFVHHRYDTTRAPIIHHHQLQFRGRGATAIATWTPCSFMNFQNGP